MTFTVICSTSSVTSASCATSICSAGNYSRQFIYKGNPFFKIAYRHCSCYFTAGSSVCCCYRTGPQGTDPCIEFVIVVVKRKLYYSVSRKSRKCSVKDNHVFRIVCMCPRFILQIIVETIETGIKSTITVINRSYR